jgi:hypothetical protein
VAGDLVPSGGGAADPAPAWFDASVVGLVMGALTLWLSRTVADPDLWGHVKFGEDIWASGRVVHRDPYSYLTGDQPWVNHEWLSETVFYLVFRLSGSAGLVVLKTALSLVIVGLIYRHLCRQGLTPLRAGIVLLLAAFLLPVGLGTVRPQLFTYLGFTLLLLMIHAAKHGRRGWLRGAPLLFALWVNAHGGFLVGAAVLLGWAIVHAGAAAWRTSHPVAGGERAGPVSLAAVLLASGLATLLNPYGAGLLAFLVQPATVVRPEITEWEPLRVASLAGLGYLAILALGVASVALSRRPRQPSALVLLLGVALLPLTAFRHAPLVALAVPLLAGEHIADAWRRGIGDRDGAPAGPWARRGLAGASLAAAVLLVAGSVPSFRCPALNPGVGGGYPARAVGLLRESGAQGNLAVFFTWGEYAIWHLAPRIKVSWDGRRETVYSEHAHRVNLDFLRGAGAWDALLTEHPTDLALVPAGAAAFNLLKLHPGWVLVYEDALSGLFARQGSPLVERIRGTPPPPVPHDGSGLCFP